MSTPPPASSPVRALGVTVAALLAAAASLAPLWWPDAPAFTEPLPSRSVAVMDRIVASGPADVVVVSDSSAIFVDPEQFGAALSDPPARVHVLVREIGGSGPVWYAMLRERVYAHGLRPKLVVLMGYLSAVARTRLPDSGAFMLEEQVSEPDAVLREKGGLVPRDALGRVQDRARNVQARWTSLFRDLPAAWVFGVDAETGREKLSIASAALFGALHEAAPVRALPAVVAEDDLGAGGAFATRPEDTFLPDIARLVAENGGKLAVVLPPALHGEYIRDQQPPSIEKGLPVLAEQLGVTWLDERGFGLEPANFGDPRHLNAHGAALLMRTVGDALRSGYAVRAPVAEVSRTDVPAALARAFADAVAHPQPGPAPCVSIVPLGPFAFLTDDALSAVAPALPSPIRVFEGEETLPVPATPGAPGACDGTVTPAPDGLALHGHDPARGPIRLALSDAVPVRTTLDDRGSAYAIDRYWAYPGTTLTWRFDRPWAPPDGAYTVELELQSVGPGVPTPMVLLAGRPLPIEVRAGRVIARGPGPTAGGAWSLAVTAPADGPFLVVRALTLVAGDRRAVVVAPPPRPAVDAIAIGTLTPLPAPAPLPAAPVLDGAPAQPFLPAPFRNVAGCSPLRAVVDGAELPPYVTLDAGQPEGHGFRRELPAYPFAFPAEGASHHVRDRVYIGAPGGADPLSDGRAYQVGFAADRRCWAPACPTCEGRVWVYPGDALTLTVPQHAGPVRVLTVEPLAGDAAARSGPLHVEVRAGGVTRVSADLPREAWSGDTRLALDPPIAASESGDMTLTLTLTPADPSVVAARNEAAQPGWGGVLVEASFTDD